MAEPVLHIRSNSQNMPGPARDGTATPTPLSMRPGNVRFYSNRRSNDEHSTNTAQGAQPTAQSTSQQQQESSPTLEETRGNALGTLAMCRNVIATLEVTRMYKSRLGFCWWLAFWERLYERALARSLGAKITNATTRINALFRGVALDLNRVTQRMEIAVRQAGSEREILKYLEHMEYEVGIRRRSRRKKAAMILNKMRASIETIPVKVTDDLFDDMKRGVFGLDVFCDYHPGDPQAEERDRSGQAQLLEAAEAARSLDFYQWELGPEGEVTYQPPGLGSGNLEAPMPEAIDTVYGSWVSETGPASCTMVPNAECGNLGGSTQCWIAIESPATANW